MKWFLRALPLAMGFACAAIAANADMYGSRPEPFPHEYAQTYTVSPVPYTQGYQVFTPDGRVIVNIDPVPYMPGYYTGMRSNGSTAFTIDPVPFMPGEYTIDTWDAFE